ncbi:MAG: mandelate racemase/muconate lactonizing enzyme family protein [Acidobacteriota bacterium]|nr:mandelate racemase/muconate lactonizing enzyme family protein [Acidobacteriota bacterium]
MRDIKTKAGETNARPSLSRRSVLKLTAAGALGAGALITTNATHARREQPPTPGIVNDVGTLKVKDVQAYVVPGACYVQITASNGVSGWGETDADNPPVMGAFVNHGLKQEVIGESVWDGERLWDMMFYKNHDLGPGGGLANSIAGVDMALWDLKGKLLGLPVYQLLGGMYRDRVRAYGSFGISFGKTHTPDEAAAQAVKLIRQGFTAIKLRMQIREYRQNPDPDPTLLYARAVRHAIGPDIDFWVDINGGYNASRAIEMAKRLKKEFNVMFFEEPVSDQTHTETAAVVRAVDMPVIMGEKEYTRWQERELIIYGNPDILNPDPIKAGGLTEMKKIAAIAQAYGKPIMCHNTRPTLSTAAALHFCASIPNCGPLLEFVDLDSDKYRHLPGYMKNNVRFENGYLHVPQGPGLGLEVNEEKIRGAAKA